jgi:uncharacterized protein YnzC (UPF0291/DUF896 family)
MIFKSTANRRIRKKDLRRNKMTAGLVERINELAKKAKTTGLTPQEDKERAKLRKQYLKEFREGMESNIMSNLYIVDEKGNKTKVVKKK